MFSLRGKTVVVTGGGRGIGRGISLCMAEAGANVVMTGRNAEALEATQREVEAKGAKTLILPGDIGSVEMIDGVVAKTVERFGYIDCWVNNAGSADGKDVGPLFTLDEGKFDRVVDLNLKWAFFGMLAAAKSMTKGGSIVNITSRSGSQPCPNTGQYGAAKAGLESLTATAAVEWGHLNIRVNGIAPGVVITERNASGSMSSPGRIRRQIETVPLRRLGKVDDIGWLAVYFAADESAWISGQVVQATGGSRLPIGLLTYLHHVNERMAAAEAKEG
jgi:NAD(P)-dependent dehydrogenase (short-subunit alcohol dehydrogenase family)